LNEFAYLKKGKVIGVPTLYCKKAVIYVDEKQMVPVSISLFDDEGLFESYTFSSITVNKPFPKDEFLLGNKAYGF
jgi:outer membrane lipoprotein-sorting protein